MDDLMDAHLRRKPQDKYPKYYAPNRALEISETAAKMVRMNFNPSGVDGVAELKCIAAAFITLCEKMRAQEPRSFAEAITNMQTASMFAVHGATAHL